MRNIRVSQHISIHSYCITGATPAKDSVLPMYVAPSYDPPICSVDQPNRTPLLQQCENNEYCLFDYIATGGRDIALRTKSMSMRIHELRHFLTPGKDSIL